MKNFFKNPLSFAVVMISAIVLFVAADRVDTYHINLKGDMVGLNTAQKQYPILMKNRDGVTRFSADSAGNVVAAGTFTYNAVVNAGGISTIKGLSVGTAQNSQLADLTITNYAGTTEATIDSTGLIVAHSVAWGTGQNTKAKTVIVNNFAGTEVYSIDTLGGIAASHYYADTSAFTTSALRQAVYIAGAKPTDKYVVSVRNQSEVIPVAGDLMACFVRIDSLVVVRAVGTTSGLKFSYIRVK